MHLHRPVSHHSNQTGGHKGHADAASFMGEAGQIDGWMGGDQQHSAQQGAGR